MFRNIDCNAAFKTRKNLRGNLESHIPITIYKRLYCPDWLEYSTSLVCQLLKAFYITICHIHSFIHRIIHGKGRHAGATCSSGVIQCFLSKASYDFFFCSAIHTHWWNSHRERFEVQHLTQGLFDVQSGDPGIKPPSNKWTTQNISWATVTLF